MDYQIQAEKLLAYLDGFDDFVIKSQIDGLYNHMGATITDAILQSGINYATVVKPRVNAILEKYPNERTTSNFLELILSKGVKNILNWQDDEKPMRVIELTRFFILEEIETEQDLLLWISNDENIDHVQSVRGVGPKTADYLRILVGYETSAVDRYVFRILEEAGFGKLTYEDARSILDTAADSRGISRARFDYSIWSFMSERGKNTESSSSTLSL